MLALLPVGTFAQMSQLQHDCSNLPRIPANSVRSARDLQFVSDMFGNKMVALHNLRLFGEDLSGLNLANLCFEGGDFEKTVWSNTHASNLIFHDADLNRSRWNGFKGENLFFHGSQLEWADFSHGQFRRAHFRYTTIEGLDARYADLSSGSFAGNWLSSLSHARFDHADLSGFHFECGMTGEDICGQYSENISFRDTNLTGAVLDMASMADRDFASARLNSTSMPLYVISEMRRAVVEGPINLISPPWSAIDRQGDLASVNPDQFDHLRTYLNPQYVHETAPSFDCLLAKTVAEYFICKPDYSGFPQLAYEDVELARAYKAASYRNPAILGTQKAWLKLRDECLILYTHESERLGCFRERYEARTDQLWLSVKGELNLPVGEKMLFVGVAEDFNDSFLERDLFSSLAVMIARNSESYVVLEALPNGRLIARGLTVGGNAHMGSISSPEEGLMYHSESGCYVAQTGHSGGKGQTLYPIIRITGDALTPQPRCEGISKPEHNDWIMTGARASFRRMRQLPLSTQQIDDLLDGQFPG
ncbi:pentapeptide repeat-containing protein [Alterisphingorhabdus coralli]|uniref:Pentapeptide repeat-containing protein n=1 Tax=Alterisphingorhabdus coralli TaxID=3071408 RepID=A0AA97I2M3_9SPHN|nr:pentapeptide repeat-containing protein [Parasphingorhabdus sp. SCSIO 66989]WOE76560.1 pentapeptide repeat-containing protein [Parasphingorhabdus sp. SCSIO 66989]